MRRYLLNPLLTLFDVLVKEPAQDNPWGAIVALFVAGFGGYALKSNRVTLAEYLTIVVTAGGLLGVGHSFNRGVRRFRPGDLSAQVGESARESTPGSD
jgi:hypothetical protein